MLPRSSFLFLYAYEICLPASILVIFVDLQIDNLNLSRNFLFSEINVLPPFHFSFFRKTGLCFGSSSSVVLSVLLFFQYSRAIFWTLWRIYDGAFSWTYSAAFQITLWFKKIIPESHFGIQDPVLKEKFF